MNNFVEIRNVKKTGGCITLEGVNTNSYNKQRKKNAYFIPVKATHYKHELNFRYNNRKNSNLVRKQC